MKKIYLWGLVAAVTLFVFGGCASMPPAGSGTVQASGTVDITASSFSFTPSKIQVSKPQMLDIHIKNVSHLVFNFTIKNPDGEIMRSVDLPPGRTTTVTVDLNQIGTYPFYSNRPPRAEIGLRGDIVLR